MNWDALGSIAEVVAAAAVVVSIAYLSQQIREGSKSTRLSALDSWVSDYNALLLELLQNPDVSAIFRRGLSGFSNLVGDDAARFHFFMSAHLLISQRAFAQLREGVLDKPLAEQLLEFNASLLATPGGQEWWKGAREVWNEAFVSNMESRMKHAKPITNVWPWLNYENKGRNE